MDGEHAFLAFLTLVMVNVAFPHNEKDAKAMDTALSVLMGMAEKGNEYIQARLSLLINLHATIGRRSPKTTPERKMSQTIPDFTATHEMGSMPSTVVPSVGPCHIKILHCN